MKIQDHKPPRMTKEVAIAQLVQTVDQRDQARALAEQMAALVDDFRQEQMGLLTTQHILLTRLGGSAVITEDEIAGLGDDCRVRVHHDEEKQEVTLTAEKDDGDAAGSGVTADVPTTPPPIVDGVEIHTGEEKVVDLMSALKESLAVAKSEYAPKWTLGDPEPSEYVTLKRSLIGEPTFDSELVGV